MDLSKGSIPITLVIGGFAALLYWGGSNELTIQGAEWKKEITAERTKELVEISTKLDNLTTLVSRQMSDLEPFKKQHYELVRKAAFSQGVNLPIYDDLAKEVFRNSFPPQQSTY